MKKLEATKMKRPSITVLEKLTGLNGAKHTRIEQNIFDISNKLGFDVVLWDHYQVGKSYYLKPKEERTWKVKHLSYGETRELSSDALGIYLTLLGMYSFYQTVMTHPDLGISVGDLYNTLRSYAINNHPEAENLAYLLD